MSTPTELQLAWMAGFFDGEGTVIVERSVEKGCRHGFRTSLHAGVSQTSTPCLEVFMQHFGGNIATARNCTPNGRRWSVQYQWRVRNEAALRFLSAIEPYTVVKREQIAVALAYPMYDMHGRKFGSLKSPMPEVVMQQRLDIRERLQAIRAADKTPAFPAGTVHTEDV